MPHFVEPPLFKDRPILFLDFEMTGLEPQLHEIIEVAALLVDSADFSITSSYYTKVKPTHIDTADPEALKIIDYSPQNWQDALPLRQALLDLSALAPDCILAGFGIQNEWNFLLAALEREHLPYFFNHNLLEVWTLAYVHFIHNSEVSHIGLSNVCRLLDIPLQRHRPDSDIRATYEAFKYLIQNPAPLQLP